MEFDDIRTFVAVADAGSVSHAARELYLTQPAVTRRVQRLETSLGTMLLDRKRRPFALTQNGHAVLERCRRVLSSMHDVRAATAPGRALSGELRIGVAHALTEIAMTHPLDRVRAAYPGVNLRLSTGWSRGLFGQVRSGQLDAAVLLLPEADGVPSGVGATELAPDELVIVQAKRTHARPLRSVKDLNGAHWILNPEGCGARAALQRALIRAGVSFSVALETYNYDLQLQLVARNRGLSLVPLRILQRNRLRSRLRVLRIAALQFPWTIWSVRSQVSLSGGLDLAIQELDRVLIGALKKHGRNHS